MNVEERIEALSHWGTELAADKGLDEQIHEAYLYNKWFTEDNTRYMLAAITRHFLNKAKLQEWLAKYNLPEDDGPKRTIGIVMAGNIPLVGFHDLLCVWVAGQKALVKLSSKDDKLLPYIVKQLVEMDACFGEQIEFVERLANFNAVIATGSNNSARYFEQYFGKYPNIIRRNRNSVAVLDGTETRAELMRLGDDIFRYFGLGCRNVSKLYVPEGYDFTVLLNALEPFGTLMMHDKYKNNYDYQRTLLLMNKTPHFASDFLMVKEDKAISSPIATLNYEYYTNLDDVKAKLKSSADEIQCMVGKLPLEDALPLGQSQEPELWDYADKIDTLEFVVGLC